MSAGRAMSAPRPGVRMWLGFVLAMALAIGFMVGLGRYRMHQKRPVVDQQVVPGAAVMLQDLRITHKSLSTTDGIPDGTGTSDPPDPGSVWVVLSLHLEFGADGYGYESFPCSFELHTGQAVYEPSTDSVSAPDGGTGCYNDHLSGSDQTIAAGTQYDVNVWWQIPAEVAEQPLTARIIAGKPRRAVEFTR